MKQPGFTLLEVLIGVMISGLIGSMLFTTLYQTTQYRDTVDNLMEVTSRAALVQRVMEKDIMGAFFPTEAQPQQDMKKTSTKVETKKDTQKAKQQITAIETTKKKKKPKPLEQFFSGTKKDKRLDTLTFITHNPMQVYWSERAGKPKPRIARVVYRLVPNKRQKDTFILQRQEGTELDFAAYKQTQGPKAIKAYDVIDEIKDMRITYIAQLKKKEEKKKAQPKKGNQKKPGAVPEKKEEQKKREKPEYKEFDTWPPKVDKELEKRIDKLPVAVTVTVQLWQEGHRLFKEFTFPVAIVKEISIPEPRPDRRPRPSPKDKKNKDSSQGTTKMSAIFGDYKKNMGGQRGKILAMNAVGF